MNPHAIVGRQRPDGAASAVTAAALQDRIVEALVAMNAAIRNIRLYPPGSGLITHSVRRAHEACDRILAEHGPFTLSESEKELLVVGAALSEKNRKKPQTAAFLQLMHGLGIRSLAFTGRMPEGELRRFLWLLSRPAEETVEAGGFEQAFVRQAFEHLRLDRKRYIAVSPAAAPTASPDSARLPASETAAGPLDQGSAGGLAVALRPGGALLREAGAAPAPPGAAGAHDAGGARPGHRALAEMVADLYRGGKHQTADRVMGHMARGLSSGNPAARASALKNLGEIGQRLLEEKQPRGMGHLLHLLAGWLAEEKRLSDPYRRMGLQGRDWTRAMLHRGHYGAAEPLLEALGGIMTETAADPTRRAFAAEMLRGVAGQGTIDHLLEAAQAEGAPTPGSPGRSLALLLGVALDRLLDRLRDSHDMSERVRLIKVLSEVGGFSPQILVERIKGGGPWYFLRNLVLLLGKLGGEPHAAVLVPLLNHEDVRVRSEALNALHAIGGGMREKALLGALKTADERLRLSIVSMLGAMESSAAVPHLLQLLEARTLIGTRSRSELEEKICAALGRIGSPEALPVLQAIAEKKGLVPLRTYAAAVRQAAREALNAIAIRNPAGRRALPPSGAAGSEGQVEEAGPPEDLPAILAREEQRIARMIAEKGLDAAVQLLLQRILAYAHAGELEAAGRLRARLSEINPLALAELVQADDAIAQGRKGSFNHRELETWRELYDSLGAEEANALYVALRPLTVAAGETLVRPGDRNPDLFFVHSGELKVSCRTGSEERLVSIVGPGEVTGGESFFNATVATAAIGAVTRAELGLLSREAVDGWSTAFPDLGVKLREFCAPFGVAPQALEARGINRREHPRQAVEGEIHCRLEDAQGLPLGRAFKGRMVDASGGGICFQVRVATPPTAHLLLGRRLHCTLPGAAHLAMLPPPPLAGRVVAVRPLREDRFSIHLQFERPPQRGAQGQGPTAPA